MRSIHRLEPGLRPGITVEEAADTLWALLAWPFAHQLIELRGWGSEKYGAWFEDAVRRLLLDERRAAAP